MSNHTGSLTLVRQEQSGADDNVWRLVSALWPHFSLYRWQLALIALCLLLEMAFNAAFPLSLKILIDHALLERDGRLLGLIVALLGAGVVVVSIAGLARDRLYARVGANVMGNLRLRMFNHMQGLSMDFFSRLRMGDILSRFSGDLAGVENFLATALPWGVLPMLEVLSSTALLFALDYRLALIAVLIFPLSLIGPRIFAPRAVVSSYQKKEKESSTLSAVQEAVMAQPVVKAFGLELPLLAGFCQHNTDLFKSTVRVSFLSALVERSAGITILMLNVVIIGTGAWLVFGGSLSVGSFVSFETVFLTLSYSLSYISQYVPSLVQAAGSVHHIERLLAQRPRIVDAADAKPLRRLKGEIVFRDVSFSYTGEQLNLRDLNLRIPYGSFAAFVGASGSGKSTLLNLLLRFYDPQRGSIVVDGHELTAVRQDSWRSQVAVVFQENFLFDTTIRENIRLGSPQATDEEVEAAAKAAEIHDFIISLPKGYDTVGGERGSRFSGGQRQRMAIARAILRDPAVLILDEATSALDAASEASINATLARIARGRTVVSITHRLRSVRQADQIFVLEHGRMIESGRHQELLALGGVYCRLWQVQHEDQGAVEELKSAAAYAGR
jgi:ATP-binding cassette subfamily B protein